MAGTDEVTVFANAGKQLSREEIREKLKAKGYPDAAVEGMLQNIWRESAGYPGIKGDKGESVGLFQYQGPRREALQEYAKTRGKSWTDADVQIDFADDELKTKFPELRKSLLASTDAAQANDQFKRIYERPASVLWSNNASGGPVLGTDRFRFSDYAMGENRGRNSSLMYMSPDDYLALSPEFQGDHLNDRSRKSLLSSVNKGDEIDSVPSLDVKVKGPTATVTGQDGRHRAYMAGEEGLDQIPVAINQTGQGSPSEITGMQGNTLPMNFQPADKVSREPSERGLLGRVMDTIVPSAHAEERPQGAIPDWAQDAPAEVPDWAQEHASPPKKMGVLDEIGTGMLDPVVGGAQLIGNVVGGGMSLLPGAVGRAGQGLRDYTNRHVAEREAGIAAERGPDAGIDWWRGLGNVAATLPLGAIGAGARGAMAAGAIGGATAPTTDPNYWTDKAVQTGLGAGLGGAMSRIGTGAASLLRPPVGTAARRLADEGVELTPGMIGGARIRRVEDAMSSIPAFGLTIKTAQQRALGTFNRAAVNRGLSDIGTRLPDNVNPGYDAMAFAQHAFDQAYDRVIPQMRGVEDPIYRQEMATVLSDAAANNMPRGHVKQLQDIIGHEIVERFNLGNGSIGGRDAKTINSQLRVVADDLAKSSNYYDKQLGRSVKRAQTVFEDMMARQNPGLKAAEDQIDKGYAQFKVVQDATMRGKTENSPNTPPGTFTAAQLDAAVKAAAKRQGRSAAYARGEARMQDLAKDGVAILPRKVPDSGTPERLAVMGILSGSVAVSPVGAAALAAGMVPYTKIGQRALSAPLTHNILRNIGRAAGPVGTTLGRSDIPSMLGSEMPTMLVRPNQPAQMQ